MFRTGPPAEPSRVPEYLKAAAIPTYFQSTRIHLCYIHTRSKDIAPKTCETTWSVSVCSPLHRHFSPFKYDVSLQERCDLLSPVPYAIFVEDAGQTAQKLDALLRAGVRVFVDLTEPHELFPYAPHLAARCARLGIDPAHVQYHNFPIRDRALPTSAAYVRKIIAVLRDNERRGRVAAVHCRGGIGRTGLIVGCWLVECGIARDGDDALRMIAEEWKTVEKCKRYPLSPETGPQFEYVRTFERAAWIDEKHEVL